MALRINPGALVAALTFVIGIALPAMATAQVTPNAATVAGTVETSAGLPVADAVVTLSGRTSSSVATKTDGGGKFVFEHVPYGLYQITAHSPTFGSVTKDAISVNGDVSVTVVFAVQSGNLKTIAHVNVASRSSITVQQITLSPGVLRDQGETTWRHVLDQIPGVTIGTGTGNQPESNTGALPESPLSPQVLQIGGALPYESSASIDGMPIQLQTYNTSSAYQGNGVDLSVLDPYAFETYTVSTGPSADVASVMNSVGGNLNLVPPGYVGKDRFGLSTSTDPYGGYLGSLSAAFRTRKLSVSFNYGYDNSPGPLTGELPFSNLDNIQEINGQPFSCGAGPYPAGCESYPYLSFGNGGSTGYNSNFGTVSTPIIACCVLETDGWSKHYGSASLYYQLSKNAFAQVFYQGLGSREADPQPYISTVFAPPTGYSGAFVSGTSPMAQSSQNGGGIPFDTQFSSILMERLGFKIGPGTLRLSAMSNESGTSSIATTPTNVNYKLYGGGYYYDAATGNYDTPVFFDGVESAVTTYPGGSTYVSTLFNNDESASYSLPIGKNFEATASYVTTHNAESYINDYTSVSYNPGSPPSTYTSSSSPSGNYYRTSEYRIELNGMITPKLTAELSYYMASLSYHGQIQDYSLPTATAPYTQSFNDETFHYETPRLGLSYDLNNDVTLRASLGGSFVAPPFDDYLGAINEVYPNSNPPTEYTDYTENLNLQPETAFAYSLGADVRLAPRTVMSVYGYLTNLHGQFYTDNTLVGTLNSLPVYSTQPRNLAQSRDEGLSLSLAHDVDRGWYQQLRFGLTRGYVTSLPVGFYNTNYCTKCSNLQIVPNANGTGQPYSQGFALVGYRWRPELFAALDATYYGPNNSYFRPAFAVVDLNAGVPVNKYLTLHGTVRNVTGEYDRSVAMYDGLQSPVIGEPTAYNAPYWVPGAEYGPRTFLLTLDLHVGSR